MYDQQDVSVEGRPGLETAEQLTAVHAADIASYSQYQQPAADPSAADLQAAPAMLDTPAQLATDAQLAANEQHAARVEQLAQAINLAENGGDPNGGRRANPGNLTDAGGVLHFVDAPTGWAALRERLYFDFIEAKSKLYAPSMSFRELAWMWVAGGAPGEVQPHARDNPENWAAIVAGRLGVAVTSTVGDFLNGSQT